MTVLTLLILQILTLIVTYLASTRVRAWWHGPVPTLVHTRHFCLRSKLRFLIFCHLPAGALVFGISRLLGHVRPAWEVYFSAILINGILGLALFAWMDSVVERHRR
jgi:hypothetical protein